MQSPPQSPMAAGYYQLRCRSAHFDDSSTEVAELIAELPDHSAAIMDLCDTGSLDADTADAIRQAIDEASRRGIVVVLAANEANVRLRLIESHVHHRAPVCRRVDSARRVLAKRLDDVHAS